MFFRSKITALLNQIDEKLTGLAQKLSDAETSGDSIRNLEESSANALEKLREETEKLAAKQNRHDMALEDMLDIWDEKSAEVDEAITVLKGSWQKETKEQLEAAKSQEQNLLALIEAYQLQMDQFWHLLGDDETWGRQLELIRQKLEVRERQAGICIVGREGEAVDLKAHEVLDVVPTTEESLSATVAAVYESGLLYKGEVCRKAKVSAYRYEAEQS